MGLTQQDLEFFQWLKENFQKIGDYWYYNHLPENNKYNLNEAHDLYLKIKL